MQLKSMVAGRSFGYRKLELWVWPTLALWASGADEERRLWVRRSWVPGSLTVSTCTSMPEAHPGWLLRAEHEAIYR